MNNDQTQDTAVKRAQTRAPRRFWVITMPQSNEINNGHLPFNLVSPPMKSERDCQNWVRDNGELDVEYYVLITTYVVKPIIKKTKIYLS